jgi:hypothetical protein
VNDRRVDTDGERQRSSSEESSELHAAGTEGDGGPPHFVFARIVDGRFQGRATGVAGRGGDGLVADDDHAPDRDLGSGISGVANAKLGRERLRVRLGRRGPFPGAPRGRPSLHVVMIGVRPDGTKELVAVEDGYRESTDSRATVLRDLKRRGLRAPVVAVADSALGFWAAVGHVWSETRAALLSASISERTRQAPEAAAAESQTGAPRHHGSADVRGGRAGHRRIRRRVRCEIPEGRRVVTSRPGAVADVLRLSRRALPASADDQHHRVPVCDGALRQRVTKGPAHARRRS